jgi:TolB protein
METGTHARPFMPRLLIAIAALAGVLLSSGCSLLREGDGPLTAKPASTTDTAHADASGGPAITDFLFGDSEPSTAAPKPANVFGEFDGQPARGPVRSVAGDNGFQQHTFADEGFDADVTTDPTGKWLCYASTRHGEHPALYLQKSTGTTVTQVTGGFADDAYPAFSPDGKTIAFCSNRTGSWQVYVMDIDGRNVVQVTANVGHSIKPTFSPDGRRLAYCSIGGRSGQWELWIANLETSEKRMIGYGLFPAWSPEKGVDRIAFQRARQRGSRWFSIWTLDLVDGEARRITEVVASTNAAVVAPSWSPDGKKLAFATVVDPTAGKGRSQQDVWTINADGTNRQRLTDGSGTSVSPCWSQDNRIFFVSNRGGTEAVWSARTDAREAMTAGLEASEGKSSVADVKE